MSGQEGGGAPHEVSGSAQEEGQEEVFIGLEEGNEGDARVLADLEGGEAGESAAAALHAGPWAPRRHAWHALPAAAADWPAPPPT